MDYYLSMRTHRCSHYIEVKESRVMVKILVDTILYTDYFNHYLPFLWIFHSEWRYHARKTAGILLGYLVMACGLILFAARLHPGLSRHSLLWALSLMGSSFFLCLFLTKVKFQAVAYTLFLFKNVSDSASLLSRMMAIGITHGIPGLPERVFIFFWELVLIPSAVAIITAVIGPRLKKAVHYTQFLPVWQRMLLIPALFFIMFYIDLGLKYSPYLYPPSHNYSVLFITIFWLICVYIVHITTLQILFLLTQSFALKEEYRTMELISDALTSQTANLQASLEQLLKARHDFRHHLVILQGLMTQGQYRSAANYVERYLGNKDICPVHTYCANTAVNALLNYYLQTAREHSVHVTASICRPKSFSMPDVDFCTILGNLLSNALESCLRQESGVPAISVNISPAASP